MDADDLEPRRKPAPLRDLNPLSIDELRAYIADMEGEIARARAQISAKEAQRAAAEFFFRKAG